MSFMLIRIDSLQCGAQMRDLVRAVDVRERTFVRTLASTRIHHEATNTIHRKDPNISTAVVAALHCHIFSLITIVSSE